MSEWVCCAIFGNFCPILTYFRSRQIKIQPGIHFWYVWVNYNSQLKCEEITIVNRKIPYNTQWQIFPREFPQLRLSELIENSVGLPAATSKGNTPSQNTHLSATLPRYARELTANLVFGSWALPFSVAKQAGKLRFQLKLCKSPLGEFPIKIFHWVF